MGRPRKQNANRYKTGRIIPSPRVEREKDIKRPVLQQRVRHQGAANLDAATDQRFSTVLGVLLMTRVITEEQFLAGEDYRRMRQRELARQDAADRSPKNIRWGQIMAPGKLDEDDRLLPDDDADTYLDDAERARRTAEARERHDALMDRLEALEPPEAATLRLLRVVQLLDRVCLDNREIALSVANIDGLRKGLDMVTIFCRSRQQGSKKSHLAAMTA